LLAATSRCGARANDDIWHGNWGPQASTLDKQSQSRRALKGRGIQDPGIATPPRDANLCDPGPVLIMGAGRGGEERKREDEEEEERRKK